MGGWKVYFVNLKVVTIGICGGQAQFDIERYEAVSFFLFSKAKLL